MTGARAVAVAVGVAVAVIGAIGGACGGGGISTSRSPAPAPSPTVSAPAPAPDDADGVEVVMLAPQPALVRTVRAAPAQLGDALGAAIFGLIAAAGLQHLEVAGPPFARYLSRGDAADPTFVVEAGVAVVKAPPAAAAARAGEVGDAVRAIELPAGPAAVVVHVGPHEALGRAHAALDRWLVTHHRRARGPRWEVYLTNPVTTPEPAAQRTKVFAPLEPAGAANQ